MSFSNLPEPKPLTRESLDAAVERVKQQSRDWVPSPLPDIIPPQAWDKMRELGWIDERGCYTQKFHRGGE